MSKSDSKPKTLLEYMGFKDPDIQTNTHDEYVLKIANKKFIEQFFKEKYDLKVDVTEIVIEKVLSDQYRKFGFLDVYFEALLIEKKEHYDVFYNLNLHHTFEFCRINNTHVIPKRSDKCGNPTRMVSGFFEVKTGNPTIGVTTREMEYYKDVLSRNLHHRVSYPILISNQKYPNNFNQFDFFPLKDIDSLTVQDKESEV